MGRSGEDTEKTICFVRMTAKKWLMEYVKSIVYLLCRIRLIIIGSILNVNNVLLIR
jgi:hypothetical protein